MIVVRFEEHHNSHDCWGGHESFRVLRVEEFPSLAAWEKFSAKPYSYYIVNVKIWEVKGVIQ